MIKERKESDEDMHERGDEEVRRRGRRRGRRRERTFLEGGGRDWDLTSEKFLPQKTTQFASMRSCSKAGKLKTLPNAGSKTKI
jgi:hypothetical protein